MSQITTPDPEILRKHSTWLMIYGVVLIALGILAIALPGIASLAATVLVGWLFVAGGVFGAFAAFSAGRSMPNFWLNLLIALLYIAAGALLLINPIAGVLTLTLVVAAYFLAAGVLKIVMAFNHRRDMPRIWGWTLLIGLVDVVLALLIISGYPGTAVWVIGLLVGINLLMTGIGIVVIAAHLRSAR
jgi:uncharacterized membrane protein HdeD (DUF308 family)